MSLITVYDTIVIAKTKHVGQMMWPTMLSLCLDYFAGGAC